MRQANDWSCYPTAASFLTGIPVNDLVTLMGHDGSQIVDGYPAGFTHSELALALLKNGYGLGSIDAICGYTDDHPIPTYPDFEIISNDLVQHTNKIILVVLNQEDRCHALAWDGETVMDPWTGDFTEDVPECYRLKTFEPIWDIS